MEVDSDIENADPLTTKITHSEAVMALNISIEWAKQNEIGISDILRLKAVHEKAIMAKLSVKQVQRKITSFFEKQ